MLLRALAEHGLDPEKDVTIIAQMPEVAGAALKSAQVDANAAFVPFGELFPFRGLARKILDGSSIGMTTVYGIQTRSDFASKYPELVVAYLKATLEASRLIREDPEGYSEKLAQWTGIEAEVYYAFHGPHGIEVRDYSLKPEFVQALRQAVQTAKVLKKIKRDVEVSTFVDDRFIRQAAKELGYDYDAQLTDYRPAPFVGSDNNEVHPIDEKQVAQVWVSGEPKVRLYTSITRAFAALTELEAQKKKARVIFVHDNDSGLKLFAEKAWFVWHEGQVSAFLEKAKAERFAETHTAKVVELAAARKL